MPSVSLIAGGFLLLYALWRNVLYPAFFSPLSKIPNAHFTVPFTELWILWKRYAEQENHVIHAAHEKHGKIVRLGPNEVSVASVDDGIRLIYGGGFEKSAWYPNQFDNFGVPCMFSMADSKPHSIRKRMISNVYSKSYVQSSSDLRKISKILIYNKFFPFFDSVATRQESVDVLLMNYSITMDFIHAFIFGLGNSTNFLQEPHIAKEWLDTYASRRPFRFWDGELPALKTLSKRLRVPIVPAWVADATSYIENWTLESCKTAKAWTKSVSTAEEDEGKTAAVVIDQLELAINTKNAQDRSLGPPHLQVASEVLDHLAAGHETSGITLTYLFWELSRNPALQDSLQNELLTLKPPIERVSSSPSRELPDPRMIDGLPLLHAVLMETLRIHSAIPGSQPRKTPSPPTSVAGSPPLPPGTRISAHAYSLHRNSQVFPDPEAWKPSRWLDCSEKEKAEMSRWFWAFGSGGRMCIGSNLAMQNMKLITAAVYTNFKSSIVDDSDIEQVDAYTAPPKGKVWLVFSHRY